MSTRPDAFSPISQPIRDGSAGVLSRELRRLRHIGFSLPSQYQHRVLRFRSNLEHHFEKLSADFSSWVLFWGPPRWRIDSPMRLFSRTHSLGCALVTGAEVLERHHGERRMEALNPLGGAGPFGNPHVAGIARGGKGRPGQPHGLAESTAFRRQLKRASAGFRVVPEAAEV